MPGGFDAPVNRGAGCSPAPSLLDEVDDDVAGAEARPALPALVRQPQLQAEQPAVEGDERVDVRADDVDVVEALEADGHEKSLGIDAVAVRVWTSSSPSKASQTVDTW